MKKLYLLDLSTENSELFEMVRDKLENLKRVIYIVPTKASMDYKKQLFIKKLNGFSNLSFYTFDDFKKARNNKILIDETFKGHIIKRILKQKNYKNLSYSSGLASVLLDFINKSRESLIEPVDLNSVKSEVLKEVVDVYTRYDDFLNKNNLTDLADLNEHYKVDADLIIVDEFYSLKKTEYELIRQLSENIDTVVNIPYFLKDLTIANSMKESLLELNFTEIDLRSNISISEFLEEKINSKELFLISEKSEDENLREVFKEIKRDILEGRDASSIAILPFSSDVNKLLKVAHFENMPLNSLYNLKNKSPIVGEFKDVLNYFQIQNRENILKLVKSNYFRITETSEEMEYEIGKLKFKNLDELLNSISVNIEIESKNLDEFMKLTEQLTNIPNKNLNFKEYCNICREYLKIAENRVLENHEKLEDSEILKRDLSAIDFLDKSLKKVEIYDNYFYNSSFSNFSEVILNYIDDVNYSKFNSYAPKTMKPGQSLGVKFNKTFICGLNSKYPSVEENSFLFSNMSKEEIKKYSIKDENYIYEEGLLIILNLIGNSKSTCIVEEENKSMYFDLFEGINHIETKPESSKLELSLKVLENLNFKDIKGEGLSENFLNYEELQGRTKNTLLNEEAKLSGNSLLKLQKSIDEKGFAVSDFDRYVNCPYNFLYSRLVGIEEMKREYEEEFFLDMGNFYHKVLEKYFKNYPSELNEDYLSHLVRIELFENISPDLELKGLDKIKYENAKYILKNFIEMDLSERENFKPTDFEVPFKLNIEDVKINGRIDRIDSFGELEILTDYKLNNSPSFKDIAEGRAFQLPLYIMSQKEKVVAARYGSINSCTYKNVLVNSDYLEEKGLSDEDFSNLVENSRDTVLKISSDIKDGLFPRVECEGCEFRDLCRQVIL
ncbi:ATP-dependent helicase/DNAse subunit B [Anaerosphaera aminiphila DSM 21120]|uniref:ATP-dependent helicase/DNAse subunit B n=1 Tax=Anaerosphaera aminiphila DSM 21120 TaxID=1120995 RepID=A0A1M5R4F1_9FIRM|nr:PD-(D/E)XK nuclease family protein [Anaerosphaera aminiphila]SHH20643.1 ATP-dependent helicase/DNAse subunit B [Anaerosphaera aminiphila DSM 21120]